MNVNTARGLHRSARSFLAAAVVAAVLAPAAQAQVAWSPAEEGYPRTAAELNGFTAHTRHLEMWDYLESLRAASTEMRLGTYGETRQGRELAYAVYSRPLVSEPWEAWALGRPIVVTVDAERIRLVLGNLLTNALRHSDPEGPPVRVALQVSEEEVLLEVRDWGEGIGQEDLPRVFEPFYRVDRSRSKDTGGYGIGLSLAKRIVEAHGGVISIDSRVGEGTSVRASLPSSANGQRRESPRW